MKKLVAFLALVMVTGLLSGCSNTAEGAGRDIEGMGQWMQDTF
jgi:predicted small secreted protein